MSKPPNILVLTTDQQRADATSCAGNLVLRTPAMDAIPASGVRVSDACVSTPVVCGLAHELHRVANVNECARPSLSDGSDNKTPQKHHTPKAATTPRGFRRPLRSLSFYPFLDPPARGPTSQNQSMSEPCCSSPSEETTSRAVLPTSMLPKIALRDTPA